MFSVEWRAVLDEWGACEAEVVRCAWQKVRVW